MQVLQFETLGQFFLEYEAHYCNKPEEPVAARETFRKTWKKAHKCGKVRFSRGKGTNVNLYSIYLFLYLQNAVIGTFPTCDICNNANDLLASRKAFGNEKLTSKQRDIFLKFKVCYPSQYSSA